MFENVPAELKAVPQWIVWRFENAGDGKKPTKVPYSAVNTSERARVNDPSTFASFETARAALQSGWFSGLGFILTTNDPFTFIDLDDTCGDTSLREAQYQICARLNSYTELSPSKSGVHIIVKGTLPAGRKRNKIELYSDGRFMTVTGDYLPGHNPKIENRQDMIIELFETLGGKEEQTFYDGNAAQTKTDDEIINIASNAENADKFIKLHSGDWQGTYPSQSEADLAYINILAFYTQCREQICRIFKNSPLGARNKQTSIRGVDYLNYMINKSFDRILPPVDISVMLNRLNESIANGILKNKPAEIITEIPAQNVENPYTVPPGLMGEIAQFIYCQAPRPVPEIALVAAIGLMAGVCGRAYNISNTGLNQYVMLLAQTGTGKEAIAKGIEKLMGYVIRATPAATDFIGPGEIASPQALVKYMAKGPTSFVSIMGEIGLALQQMTDPRAPSHLVGLRRLLLDLYNKSGEGAVLRPTIYSDKEKNTGVILAPAFTMLGESTPERFFGALDETMISEGLLPRFTIIEYAGPRPPLNEGHAYVQPSPKLVERFAQLCAQTLMVNNSNKAVNIHIDQEAKALFDAFNIECDNRINNANKEITRHLWNRAHIKALKLAGLVSVGCDPYNPTVTKEIANWALKLVYADSKTLLDRFNAGEIGVNANENKQINEAARVIKEYLSKQWTDVAVYGGNMFLFADKIIPYTYLQRKLANLTAYRDNRAPSSDIIKRILKIFVDRGDLCEVGKQQLIEKYSFRGVAYVVSAPRAFGL